MLFSFIKIRFSKTLDTNFW